MNTILSDSTQFFTGRKSFLLLKEYIAKEIQPDKIFIFTDNNAYEHCLKPFKKILKGFNKTSIIIIIDGEQNKTLNNCENLWLELANKGASRKSLIINLGGGIVCDIGGFVASIFKRGVRFINIPTTLLAQIDASIGGKTAIDFNGVKNLLGLFSFPEAVLIHPPFINSLSIEQKKSGYAEMIKIALACDKSFWQQLTQIEFVNITNWEDLIKRAIEIKLQVINADPYETGFRKVLNFGHTIGHAVEAFSLKNDSMPLLHGNAIAMGMICETIISTQVSDLEPEEAEYIIEFLLNNFNFYSIKTKDYNDILKFIYHDKKNEHGEIKFSLLSSAGRCVVSQKVGDKLIVESLEKYKNLTC